MGGKNHQPCRKPDTLYLHYSTRMSREASDAFRLVEEANIALEDVLLNELWESGSGTIIGVVRRLAESRLSITCMRTAIAELRTDMHKNNFEDLQTLGFTNLDKLGEQFVARGIVQNQAWSVVTARMRDGGFYKMLDWFDAEAQKLDLLTEALTEAVEATEQDAKAGQLNLVLEENRPGNFKHEFAELYTAWLRFQQVFLASSMLSTELWYRYCHVGSLVRSSENVQVA